MHSNSTRSSLLGLPVELRLNIFRLLSQSLTVEVQRGQERQPRDERAPIDISRSFHISPLPGIPDDIAALRQTCKLLSIEIDDSWHSEITYYFPSTVCFIDVLSQWSEEKVRGLRYVHVVDTPLPLYAFVDPGFFVTHNFSQALPMFPGLQLELLVVENIWLFANGEPLVRLCYAATNGTIKRLLQTSGWKRLHYMSGLLPLTPTQMSQLDQAVDDYRVDQKEPGFRYGLGRVRPLTYSRENLLDPSEDPENLDTTTELLCQWYAEHQEEKRPRFDNDFSEEVIEKHVAMWAERGSEADYVQDGGELSSTLESLKSNMTWMELRKTDNYLIGHGMDEPTIYM